MIRTVLLILLTSAWIADALSAETPDPVQEKYNLATTVDAYNRVGNKNPKWDDAAREALTLFARNRSIRGKETNLAARASRALQRTLALGCDDPLILYLQQRNIAFASDEAALAGFENARRLLDASKYPEIRKFYAAARVSLFLSQVRPRDTNLHQLRRDAANHFLNVCAEKEVAPREAMDALSFLYPEIEKSSQDFEPIWNDLEPVLAKRWPTEPLAYYFRGKAPIRLAWIRRGGGYAPTVTPAGWSQFASELALAETNLLHAWSLDPKNPAICLEMMTVELGQGKGRERLELWFKRGMEIEPSYELCNSKRYYLEPKWHGSEKELLDFGRECLDATNWGPSTPLILVDAHTALANDSKDKRAYWIQPEVWKDVRASYEKTISFANDADHWRQKYAFAAYRSERWPTVLEQVKILHSTNYQIFGGKAAFDKMIRDAQAASLPNKN